MLPPKFLFQIAVFLGSLLLFLVEPMVAKELLPIFGGSSAVWITCLFFFQLALLAGYLYAHLLTKTSGTSASRVHLSLLAIAVFGSALWVSGKTSTWTSPIHPASSIFLRLTLSIGLPFIVLAATSPLLQVWLGRLESNGVPYRLFGLSNLASFLALIAYPSVIEPHLALRIQRLAWCLGIAVFAAISAVIVRKVSTLPALAAQPSQAPTTPGRRKLLWLLLPMAATMQLSAVTAHLTANVAAIPLLWVLPLAVYLLTFVVAFRYQRFVPRTPLIGLLAVLLFALGKFLTLPEMAVPIALSIGLFTAELLVACLLCHTELYKLRPTSPSEATSFYLSIATGGAIGSFLVGIAAPLIFRANYDLSITFAVTAAVVLFALWDTGLQQRLLWSAATAILLWLCLSLRVVYTHSTMMTVRNFYGSLRVRTGVTIDGTDMRTLMHGSIVHGTQIFSLELMHTPTTYSAPDSGVGLALSNCCATRPRNIGVIGLGAGTIAAYGRPGDRIRFYEINPAVRPIAENSFTYLRQSPARISFVEGDARASLNAEPPQNFDVLVIDAFSGDAIPLHLLTVQALALYRRHLAPGGILAFHVSNQFVDLEPELAALAASSGIEARRITTDANEHRGEFVANWILLSNNQQFFQSPDLAAAQPLATRTTIKPWTDDYSSLINLIHWK